VFLTVYFLRNYRPALFDSSKKNSTDRVYLLRNYRPARLLSIALLPIGVLFLIGRLLSLLLPELYQENVANYKTTMVFSTFWLIGFGIYAVVQIKKEQKLRLKLQEETEIAEARKAELEQLVTERTNQLMLQNEKLANALAELKSAQAQLIQSEKMASLGELTAGIAHEIQNPLNFVNNFSEVSKELLDEMKTSLDNGDTEDAKDIAADVIQNLEKINHHGKRADAIVKGMLQHSRTSSGIKEPTDINALADEYLRLAYHGLRAKDKSFNATLKTDFDESIGNINIIPQDIGRVILNLITNAFYAAPLPPEGGFKDPDYKHEPTIWLSTKRIVTPSGDGGVLISIRDNGPGIPQKILDKIFQPFFTTKPTGQGTGLGLSLSYDIVKAHGGELSVETKEGEGSEFIIHLPIS
jgi:signal transduction histidine kinase